jgi:hypothetical protein
MDDDVGGALGHRLGERVDQRPHDQRRHAVDVAALHARDDVVRNFDTAFVEQLGDLSAGRVQGVREVAIVLHAL